jgi:uncharacterized protein YrrD
VTASAGDRVIRARDLLGAPVVTLGGDDCAEVRDVVYRADSGALVGFTLNKRSWFGGQLPEMLPTASVHAIGKDAVMIEAPTALVDSAAAPTEIVEASPERDVIGATVLTESGKSLGEITDVILALGLQVKVVGYEVTSPGDAKGRNRTARYVPLPEQIAVSGDALVVPDEVDRFIEDDLSGFGASVSKFRAQLHASPSPTGGHTT